MNSRINAALQQLNAAYAPTGKVYQVQQCDDKYTLLIPGGGAYPCVGAIEMEQRLSNLTNAAIGRQAR